MTVTERAEWAVMVAAAVWLAAVMPSLGLSVLVLLALVAVASGVQP